MRGPTCCTNRSPPSPDGLSPRPVLIQQNPFSNLSQDPVQIKSLGNTIELSKFELSPEFRAIFENNATGSNAVSHSPVRYRNISTFNRVGSKIRKHFSKDSELVNGPSHSIAEENDNRTATIEELTQPKHNKGKERSNSLGIYDEDAKSISLGSIQLSVAERRSLIPAGRASVVSTPRIEKKAYLDQEGKDNSFPSNNDKQRPAPRYVRRRSDTDSSGFRRPASLLQPKLERRHSSASLICFKEFKIDQSDFTQDWQGMLPPMPPSPLLMPQRLPSIVSENRRDSWRLSFASDRRASHLPALIQQLDHSGEASTPSAMSGLPAQIWLRGQGLRMSSQAFASSSEGTDLELFPSHKEICVGSADFGGVDGNRDSAVKTVPLQEMRIHERLASRSLFSHRSSPQLSSWSSRSHSGNESASSSFTRLVKKSRSRFFRDPRGLDLPKSSAPPVSYKMNPDIASPRLAFRSSSSRPSPESSKRSLQELFMPTHENGRFDSYDTNKDESIASNSSIRLVTSAPPEAATDRFPGSICSLHDITPEQRSRRLTVDSSNAASEAPSFRERELELITVQARFPDGMKKGKSTGPLKSKFKEEFDIMGQIVSYPKSSILSVLQLSKRSKHNPTNFDGNESAGSLTPLTNGPNRLSTDASSSRSKSASALVQNNNNAGSVDVPELDIESASAMWQRAIRRSMDYQSEPGKSRPSIPRYPSKGSEESRRFQDSSASSWIKKGKFRASSNYEEEQEQMLPAGGDLVDNKSPPPHIHIWEDQEEVSQFGAAMAPADEHSSPRRPAIPPASWARFPSSTRKERNESALPSDNVYSKDFAIKETRNGLIEWLTSDRKHMLPHHRKREDGNLPVRLTKRLRASLDNFRTRNSTILNDSIHGRRSTTSLAGELEYPELEVLALDRDRPGALEELELEIAAAMRVEERRRRRAVVSESSVFEERGVGYDGVHGDGFGECESYSKKGVRDVNHYHSCGENCAEASGSGDVGSSMFYDECVTVPFEEQTHHESCCGAGTPKKIHHGYSLTMKQDLSSYPLKKYDTWNGNGRRSHEGRHYSGSSSSSSSSPSLGTSVMLLKSTSAGDLMFRPIEMKRIVSMSECGRREYH